MRTDVTVDRSAYTNVPRVRELLAASRFDVIVAAWPANVAYLSGFYHPDMLLTWERLHIVVWPAGGEPVFVVPRTRADNWNGAANPAFASDEGRPFIADIRGYDGEHLDMVRVLADVLREKGLDRGLVGLEFRSMPSKVTAELKRVLPGLGFDDGWPLLNEMRSIKTSAEVEVLTRVNTMTARAIESVLAGARPGETEIEVASRLAQTLWHSGAQELSHSVLGGGARGGQWHPWPTRQILEEGMLVRVDWGVREDGYTSDIARTAVIGTASPRQKDMFARLADIHDVVVDAVRPGVLPIELVQLARQHYERLGLEFRWSIVGHGIGLVLHEEPQLTVDYHHPLLEGMILEIELGWVSPQEGYHLEDLVHVGATTTTNLTKPAGGHQLITSDFTKPSPTGPTHNPTTGP